MVEEKNSPEFHISDEFNKMQLNSSKRQFKPTSMEGKEYECVFPDHLSFFNSYDITFPSGRAGHLHWMDLDIAYVGFQPDGERMLKEQDETLGLPDAYNLVFEVDKRFMIKQMVLTNTGLLAKDFAPKALDTCNNVVKKLVNC